MGRSGLHRAGNVILLLWMETGTRSDPAPKHTTAEPRTVPSFLDNKTKFLPLNPCKGPWGQEKPASQRVPLKVNSYSIYQKVLWITTQLKINNCTLSPCPYFLINLCKRKMKILFFFSKSRCQIKKIHSKQCPVPHLGRDQLERRCLKVTCTHLSSSGIGAPGDTRCRAGDTPSHLSLVPQ